MRPAGDALLSLKASVGPNGWGTSKLRQWKQGEGAGLAAGRRRGQARAAAAAATRPCWERHPTARYASAPCACVHAWGAAY